MLPTKIYKQRKGGGSLRIYRLAEKKTSTVLKLLKQFIFLNHNIFYSLNIALTVKPFFILLCSLFTICSL